MGSDLDEEQLRWLADFLAQPGAEFRHNKNQRNPCLTLRMRRAPVAEFQKVTRIKGTSRNETAVLCRFRARGLQVRELIAAVLPYMSDTARAEEYRKSLAQWAWFKGWPRYGT